METPWTNRYTAHLGEEKNLSPTHVFREYIGSKLVAKQVQLSSDLDAGPKLIKTRAATLQVVAIYVTVHFF